MVICVLGDPKVWVDKEEINYAFAGSDSTDLVTISNGGLGWLT
jgi:hypothetical protein